MKVTYLEGESRILAEADELSTRNNTLVVHLTSGKTIMRNFPDADMLNAFFDEVILTAGDQPIRLENTTFSTTLGEVFDQWDALYEE